MANATWTAADAAQLDRVARGLEIAREDLGEAEGPAETKRLTKEVANLGAAFNLMLARRERATKPLDDGGGVPHT